MRKTYLFIVLSLLFSLFVYLFYRTEKTVVNEILISLISLESFIELRNNIRSGLALNQTLIYSLPEGLWVFCITLTSKFLFLRVGKREMNLIYLPLVFSIGLEFFQLLQITKGRFDFWDVGFSILFWSIAFFWNAAIGPRQDIFRPLNLRSIICVFSYLIVYLAHVWQ